MENNVLSTPRGWPENNYTLRIDEWIGKISICEGTIDLEHMTWTVRLIAACCKITIVED